MVDWATIVMLLLVLQLVVRPLTTIGNKVWVSCRLGCNLQQIKIWYFLLLVLVCLSLSLAAAGIWNFYLVSEGGTQLAQEQYRICRWYLLAQDLQVGFARTGSVGGICQHRVCRQYLLAQVQQVIFASIGSLGGICQHRICSYYLEQQRNTENEDTDFGTQSPHYLMVSKWKRN